MNHFQIFGDKPIEVVVEMGLGSSLSEWIPFAKAAQKEKCVMLYERSGINKSPEEAAERTPENIARELHTLLAQVEHKEKIILIAHSQGGLYAMKFCLLYPDMVEKVILLDPLSPDDNLFKEQLNEEEYRKSGVDKSANYSIMRKLARWKLGWLTKSLLKKAPPFYYFNGFSKEERKDILSIASKLSFIDTVINEYTQAHQQKNICSMQNYEGYPDIPLILVTHASEPAVEESMSFGRNTREFAEKIEKMWQEIMKRYLACGKRTQWLQAKKSTHYIHLEEPEFVRSLLQ